jgi:Glu-tRNA(Gln) amidotransferase subunit E-like FAD-binding protein
MTNPVTPFRSNLFASRGCDIQAALDYVDQLATASTDPVAVQTAARVLLNTIENAVTQAQGPSPVEEALFAIIDKRIAVLQINTQIEINASIDDWMDNNLRDKMMDILANEDIDDDISNWMSNNFDITDYNVDDAIESWMENNMDDKIQEAINNLTFSVTVS